MALNKPRSIQSLDSPDAAQDIEENFDAVFKKLVQLETAVSSVANGATGDVTGPTISTDNAVVRWDGTLGELIQNSVVTIDDAGTMTFPSGADIVLVNGFGIAVGASRRLAVTSTGVDINGIGKIAGTEATNATLQLWADEGDDASDKWSLISRADTNTLDFNIADTITILRIQGSDVTVLGQEGGAAVLNLWADEGDDAADKFSLTADTAGSMQIKQNTTTIWDSNGSGEITQPTQPCFFVFNDSDDTSVSTGDSVQFPDDVYDVGDNFSNPNFTAPKTGKYWFSVNVTFSATASVTLASVLLVVSSTDNYLIDTKSIALGTTATLGGSILIHLDAGNTIQAQVIFTAAPLPVIEGAAAPDYLTWFCGSLIN